MIKGFIEITNLNDYKILINVNWIENVSDNTICIAASYPDCNTHVYFECKETYEELKRKIKDAVK